jgi:integrase
MDGSKELRSTYRLYRHPNGVYYHRVKVPVDIRAAYGKEIEQRSLRTRHLRDALRLLPAVIVEVDAAFERLRGSDDVVLPSHILQNAPEVRLDRRIPEADAAHPHQELPLLSLIAAECFASVALSKSWSPKTKSARVSHLKQIIEICGDKSLSRYTQDDIRHLKSTLFKSRSRFRSGDASVRSPKHSHAPGDNDNKAHGLSVESVRQVMTALNIVFGWARAEYDLRLINLVQPMIPRPSQGGDKRDKRHALNMNDLQKLFEMPVFTGVASRSAWLTAGSVTMNDTGRFWVPLLSLFSGLRLMEAVQLVGGDVAVEQGIYFIDVNDNGGAAIGKSVKTASSRRRIPVHPVLAKLGFIEFASAVPVDQRLFPDIPIGPAHQRHRHASKMFNRLLIRAEIKGAKKVWHSLRHSFEQACRDSRVDSAVMDELQGHAQTSMRAVYGGAYKLTMLNDGIKSINYDGLNLSHIAKYKPSK